MLTKFLPLSVVLKLHILFVSFRENGADSILDLGLLEAPEKSQVNSVLIPYT